MSFPPEFLWGAATAAYQIEGAAFEDGRVESIWDRFCRTPGKVARGENGDVACDHYHRYREDVELMAELGLRAYRFSIAWPRGEAGLDFYSRLVDALLEHGIQPAPTLYHWDLPQHLQDRGGWVNRDTAYRFADFARSVYARLGDRVGMWMTHNEPWCSSFLGHYRGVHAPGLTDLKAALVAAHHLLLSHGLAVEAYEGKGRIGIAPNLFPTYPLGPTDGEAARLSDGYTNRWFLDHLFKGRYPEDTWSHFSAFVDAMDFVEEGDLEIISAPIDFLGINYYHRRVIERAPDEDLGWKVHDRSPGVPTTAIGWEIVPQCLPDLLIRVVRDYTHDLPLYITENGAVFPDEVVDGQIEDAQRVDFLRRHFEAAARCLEMGIPLKGWFVWSLMDNFEWAMGYEPRFGLVYVDYPTQRRIPKSSARFYKAFIKSS